MRNVGQYLVERGKISVYIVDDGDAHRFSRSYDRGPRLSKKRGHTVPGRNVHKAGMSSLLLTQSKYLKKRTEPGRCRERGKSANCGPEQMQQFAGQWVHMDGLFIPPARERPPTVWLGVPVSRYGQHLATQGIGAANCTMLRD